MNRYLLATLYVMAGCAVAVPLKVQENVVPLRVERCRLPQTYTARTICISLNEPSTRVTYETVDSHDFSIETGESCAIIRTASTEMAHVSRFAYSSHKIRAPGI